MPTLLPGYEYDIFISYRKNDNRSGWVTEFVKALQEELASTIKKPVSVYFDANPHDGLLETHNVDKSLEGKLKCLIFIPILSQTYCDQKSFAWQQEFCAFNTIAKGDSLGRDIRLGNGNVASRILPVKIHDLDPADKLAIENEIGGALRAIEFIYKEPGVNRPLNPSDSRNENQNNTDYRNQVNKLANAVKELLNAVTGSEGALVNRASTPRVEQSRRGMSIWVGVLVLLLGLIPAYFYFGSDKAPDQLTEILDRADGYLDEWGRYQDDRYRYNAMEAAQKALAIDSTNGRALYILAVAIDKTDTLDYFVNRIFNANHQSVYGFLLRGNGFSQERKFTNAIRDLRQAEVLEPNNYNVLTALSFAFLSTGDYGSAWQYAKQAEKLTGKGSNDLLSNIYLELGDFTEAREQLELKQMKQEFSCGDIESYQRIFLCEGDFEKLERVTDSICAVTKCEQCPFWKLRAKMHVGKYREASGLVGKALKTYGPITWRYPAFVLYAVGKKDSALLLTQAEVEFSQKRLADTAYRQGLPLYSFAAIHAMQGNYGESMIWLRKYAAHGFEWGSDWYIAHDPLFNEAQKDPEYFADFIQIIQKAQSRKNALREKLRELETAD